MRVVNSEPGEIRTSDTFESGRRSRRLVPSALLLTGVVALVGLSACSVFPVAPVLRTGEDPRGVVIADFDGDQVRDIATVGSDGLTVLLGQGARGFAAATSTPFPGGRLDGLAIADLDQDTVLDVVAFSLQLSQVVVFHGQGDGTFVVGEPVATGTNPAAIALADLNGDGSTDAVTANSGSGDVSVLLGNGAGGLAAATSLASGVDTRAVRLADVDQNGTLDIVAANAGSATISIFSGNGDGTFQAASSVPAFGSPTSLETADFDGDGRIDLAVNGMPDPLGLRLHGVGLLLGNGDGTFTRTLPIFVGASVGALRLADLNADPNPDLLVATEDGGAQVAALVGRGDGTFDLRFRASNGALLVRDLATADLDRDGFADVVTANFVEDTVSLVFGTANGTAEAPLSGPIVNSDAIDRGDVDGDGIEDLISAGFGGTDFVVLRGRGDGTFEVSPIQVPFQVPFSRIGVTNGVSVRDLNGDGALDVVTIGPGRGGSITPSALDRVVEFAVFLGDGRGAFMERQRTTSPGLRSSFLELEDTDGDGDLDALFSMSVQDDTTGSDVLRIALFENLGDGQFRERPPLALASGAVDPTDLFELRPLAVGDLDGDDRADITALDTDGSVSVLLGQGGEAFAPASSIPAAADSRSIALGDLNGDGVLDIAIGDRAGDSVGVLIGRGDGSFAEAVHFAVRGADPDTLVLGDFNLDGFLDAATGNRASSTVSVLWGNGDGRLSANPLTFPVASQPVDLIVGDLDGNGRSDLAVAGFSTITTLANRGPQIRF